MVQFNKYSMFLSLFCINDYMIMIISVKLDLFERIIKEFHLLRSFINFLFNYLKQVIG